MIFQMNQLVSVVADMDVGDDRFGFLGRIGAVNGDDITVVAFDGEAVVVKIGNLKQVVHFATESGVYAVKGSLGFAVAIDHPRMPAYDTVTTTKVVRVCPDTGFFETSNTVYIADKLNIGGVMMKSPYLI